MTERAAARHGSDSSAQRAAEAMMLKRLGADLGCCLAAGKVGAMEIDGVSESPPILVEAWAHQGPPKGGQYHKVMNDAFKLIYARSMLDGRGRQQPRLILAFADGQAAAPFRGGGWRAQGLDAMDIEVRVVDLPGGVRGNLRHTQQIQKQAMAGSVSEAGGRSAR